MNFKELLTLVDSACWTSRDWCGHADNGLDHGVTLDDGETYHPSAFEAAVKIAEALGVEL